MGKIKTAMHLLIRNRSVFIAQIIKYCSFLFSDKVYMQLLYRFQLGRRLDLENPQFFTEKLQWLKLYDRREEYSKIVDKYEVKKIVASMVGEEFIIPTLGVWNSINDIEWELLPDKFVIKTTFGGGSDGVFFCNNKKELDVDRLKRKLSKAMNTNPYKRLREWPYKNVPKRIIAEEILEDKSGDLRDYKFYCFNGEPKVLLIASNRYSSHNFDYFDMDFNKLPITSAMGPNNPSLTEKPICFERMKIIAKQLSANYPHIRIDLYDCNNRIYFGEMTLYDSSGFDNLNSDEWDLKFGSWISLPNKKIKLESANKGFGNEGIDMFY